MIQIDEPKLEILISQRMESGAFETVEEVLLQALEQSAPTVPLVKKPDTRTGADLIAALQACPYPDFDFEPARYEMPVSDPVKF